MISICKFKIRVIFFCLLCSTACFSKTAFQDLNQEAVVAYQSGNYIDAIKRWKELQSLGNSDPDLYYNIGNAESLSGHTENAILAYEKALRFKPHDQEIKNAIQEERNKIENNVIPIQSFFIIDWYENLLAMFRPQIWAGIGLISILTGLIFWLNSMKALKFIAHPIVHKSWIFLLIGLSLLGIGILSYQKIYRLNEGILFSACELRQGPSDQSPIVRELQKGEKVKITDKISNWNKVLLLNLDDGWIQTKCIKIIDVRRSAD